MTALPTRSKDTIVATIAAGIQGRVPTFLNFALGSVFLALAEAIAGVALWLQTMVLQVLKVTRASTSRGADLHSWVADFGMKPLPARPATGLVTFGRYTAAPTAPVILVDTVVQIQDGSQKFAVYADAANPSYSAALGGYVLPAGVAQVSVPVAALKPGSAGNVAAGAVANIASSAAGIDTVTNPAAFINGEDAERDEALQARIPLYFASLRQATDDAIGYAIKSLGQGLSYQILHNRHLDSTTDYGFVAVVVDDGSGNPPDALVMVAGAAVNGVRAGGIRFGVYGAKTLPAAITMTLGFAEGFYPPDVIAAVKAALSLYINGLGEGATLRYTRLDQIAYAASPGVENVTGVRLNGATADLVPNAGQTIKLTDAVVG